MNVFGPRDDPCGIPQLTLTMLVDLLIWTVWVREIHLSSQSVTVMKALDDLRARGLRQTLVDIGDDLVDFDQGCFSAMVGLLQWRE